MSTSRELSDAQDKLAALHNTLTQTEADLKVQKVQAEADRKLAAESERRVEYSEEVCRET